MENHNFYKKRLKYKSFIFGSSWCDLWCQWTFSKSFFKTKITLRSKNWLVLKTSLSSGPIIYYTTTVYTYPLAPSSTILQLSIHTLWPCHLLYYNCLYIPSGPVIYYTTTVYTYPLALSSTILQLSIPTLWPRHLLYYNCLSHSNSQNLCIKCSLSVKYNSTNRLKDAIWLTTTTNISRAIIDCLRPIPSLSQEISKHKNIEKRGITL